MLSVTRAFVYACCPVQLKDGMAFEAGKHFNVYRYKYNSETSYAEKLRVRNDFVKVVSQHASKHALTCSPYQDILSSAKEVRIRLPLSHTHTHIHARQPTHSFNSCSELLCRAPGHQTSVQ